MLDQLPERYRKKIRAEGECWMWTAYVSQGGYGYIYHRGKVARAHRATYELLVGEIPYGLTLDHLCRNKLCVNPAHLEPVTSHENNLRSPFTTVGRKQCKRGHPFTPENTRLKVNKKLNYTMRTCRACDKWWKQEIKARRLA